MESVALQQIAQWEQAHLKGNKKPLTTREYPPIRSKKDVVLDEIKPVLLDSKELRIKKQAELNTSKSNPTTNKEPSLQKGYYESWDKFDMDQALKDADKDGIDSQKQKKNEGKPSPSGAGSASNPPKADPIAANAEKDKGNELFKKGQYEQAIERYSASIALDPSNPVLPINRAMALLKLGRFSEVERDCTLGLKLDSKNVKAMWRRGIARRSLGRLDDARKDFEAALDIEPNNKAVKDELTKLQQLEQSAPTKPTAPSKLTEKQPTIPAAKKQSPAPSTKKQEVVKSSPPPTTTATSSSTVSSKRVLIKEVENDEDSALFTSTTTRKIASTATDSPSVRTPETASPPSTNLQEKTDPSTKVSASPVVSAPPVSVPPTTPSLAQPEVPASPPPTKSNLDMQMITPTTNMEFQRDWKSYSKSNDLLYRYIKVVTSGEISQNSSHSLAKVQRFDMTLMFMSGSEKKDLQSIFQYLSQHLSDQTVYNQQNLTVLASKFKTTNY
ncbi:RNA polymerase II-associated protein 3 [Mortierella sp. GBA43]|nr:RNA polymerase II-associated protein 3 [Mortierella sp. GBA43]